MTKLYDETQKVEVTVNEEAMKQDSAELMQKFYNEHVQLVEMIDTSVDNMTSSKLKQAIKALARHPIQAEQELDKSVKELYTLLARTKDIYVEHFIASSFMSNKDLENVAKKQEQKEKEQE